MGLCDNRKRLFFRHDSSELSLGKGERNVWCAVSPCTAARAFSPGAGVLNVENLALPLGREASPHRLLLPSVLYAAFDAMDARRRYSNADTFPHRLIHAVCPCVLVYMDVYAYVYIYNIYIYMCVCVYIYKCIYIYIYVQLAAKKHCLPLSPTTCFVDGTADPWSMHDV
jgi:hypothetical protein